MSTDRRDEKERRKNRVYVELPLQDADGSIVTEDRRRNPDRRTPIIVSEADLSEEEFEMYFKPAHNK
jgi:hypothetical protein